VILDIEMPELDGISALPLMLAKKRDLVVIMASTLTRHNAEISMRALSLGAADYIPKPETNRGVTTSATFRRGRRPPPLRRRSRPSALPSPPRRPRPSSCARSPRRRRGCW
jgi:two-component system, chemotaxis family, protein-glutamate methylesterase/glutaminase